MTAKKCKMCGAPLHSQQVIVKFEKGYKNPTIIPIGYKCEYCGTEYEGNRSIYDDGTIIDEEKAKLPFGIMTMNEIRKARELPPIDEMEMKHFDR